MIHFDKQFENIDFTIHSLDKGSYENCIFTNCTLTSLNLSNFIFEDCSFENCDLSLSKLVNTSIKNVTFSSCKLLGVKFEECNTFLFQMLCIECNLHLSSFYKLSLKGSQFNACNLSECDFTETNASGVNFENCDLTMAIFFRTNLEKANFYAASNFSIDPENNRIKNALFSTENCRNLLNKYDIQIK